MCQNRQKSMCRDMCAIKNLRENWQKHQSVHFTKFHKKYCKKCQKVSKVKSQRQILKLTFQKRHAFFDIFLTYTHPNEKMSEKTVKNSQKSLKTRVFDYEPAENGILKMCKKYTKSVKNRQKWKVGKNINLHKLTKTRF